MWARLAKDRWLWLVAAVLAGVAVRTDSRTEPGQLESFAYFYATAPPILANLALFQVRLRQRADTAERRFWNLWTAPSPAGSASRWRSTSRLRTACRRGSARMLSTPVSTAAARLAGPPAGTRAPEIPTLASAWRSLPPASSLPARSLSGAGPAFVERDVFRTSSPPWFYTCFSTAYSCWRCWRPGGERATRAGEPSMPGCS